jgi:hypothetical protein
MINTTKCFFGALFLATLEELHPDWSMVGWIVSSLDASSELFFLATLKDLHPDWSMVGWIVSSLDASSELFFLATLKELHPDGSMVGWIVSSLDASSELYFWRLRKNCIQTGPWLVGLSRLSFHGFRGLWPLDLLHRYS